MSENPNAFPACNEANVNNTMGMSLRDWFAGQALCGILSGPASRQSVPMSEWFDAPEAAYKLADAMLAERAKASSAGDL